MVAGTATLTNYESKLQYGQTLFRGSWAREKFCVSLTSCVDLDFFYISYQNGMPKKIDAIIGFARPDDNLLLAPDQTPREHEYYLAALKKG